MNANHDDEQIELTGKMKTKKKWAEKKGSGVKQCTNFCRSWWIGTDIYMYEYKVEGRFFCFFP